MLARSHMGIKASLGLYSYMEGWRCIWPQNEIFKRPKFDYIKIILKVKEVEWRASHWYDRQPCMALALFHSLRRTTHRHMTSIPSDNFLP